MKTRSSKVRPIEQKLQMEELDLSNNNNASYLNVHWVLE